VVSSAQRVRTHACDCLRFYPHQANEIDCVARLKRYNALYHVELQMLNMLFKAFKLFDGAAGVAYTQTFNSIQEYVRGCYEIRDTEAKMNNVTMANSDKAVQKFNAFDPKMANADRFNGLKPQQHLILYLATQAGQKGYRKLGRYYQKQKLSDPNPTADNPDDQGGHQTQSWERDMTIRKFLLQITTKRASFEHWDNRTRAANNIDFVEKEAIENEDEVRGNTRGASATRFPLSPPHLSASLKRASKDGHL
jgi:hypothetical protein